MAHTDRLSIAGVIAVGGVVILLTAGFGLSSIPPAPSLFGVISGYGLAAALAALWILPMLSHAGLPISHAHSSILHRSFVQHPISETF